MWQHTSSSAYDSLCVCVCVCVCVCGQFLMRKHIMCIQGYLALFTGPYLDYRAFQHWTRTAHYCPRKTVEHCLNEII